MAEHKKSFILYVDIISTFEELEDIEAGKLIKHLLRYVNDLNPEAPDRLTKIAFEPIKLQLKRDLIKWESIKTKRSEAGKASANKRKQSSTKSTSVKSVQQSSTKSTVTVNDNVTVNVINKQTFESFRILYQGRKNGLETEFTNFTKKHKDWEQVLPLLEPVIKNQIENRKQLLSQKAFVPEWKHLSTWINKRCWEEEIIDEEQEFITPKKGQEHLTQEQLRTANDFLSRI